MDRRARHGRAPPAPAGTDRLPPEGPPTLPPRRYPTSATASARAGFALLGGLLLLVGACEATDPPTEEGAFVVRLGTDTTAVERYTLAGDRMEVTAVSRAPRTLVREAVLETRADGTFERFESRVLDPAADTEEPMEWTVIRYDEGEAEVEAWDGEGDPETTRIEAGPHMVPFSTFHFSLKELALRRALARDSDVLHFLTDGPMRVELRESAPDRVELDTGPLGTWVAHVDSDGRILELEAGALGRHVERVPELDVGALARRFAEEDARGEGMGPLSPRDTVRGHVRGADIQVEYGRPAQRGREIFGGLVPYGEVWRTGADLATHLVTDRPLLVEGERIPAGSYSLFTIPEPGSWTLIVNEETGQAGTQHDPDRDLRRVPLEVDTLDPPKERFTISVEEEGEGGVLRFQWADTEARLPFRVDPDGSDAG